MFWADQFNEDRICLLALEGRLSRTDLVNLAERLRGLAAQGVSQVVVDARGVDHWDYRGLPVIAEAVGFCRRNRAGVAFITSSGYLRDIAAVAGVSDRLDFYDELNLQGAAVRLTVIRPQQSVEETPLRTATGL